MKNILKKLLLMTLTLMPSMVFASSEEEVIPLFGAIAMEAFVTIHMTIFVIIPLAKIVSPGDEKTFIKKAEIARILFLLFFDFFITPLIAIVDFFAVFVGTFGLVFFGEIIKKIKNGNTSKLETMLANNVSNSVPVDNSEIVTPRNYGLVFSKSEEEVLESFITTELKKAGYVENKNLLPLNEIKRQNIINVIFDLLVLAYITLIFFHFGFMIYILGLIILVVFRKFAFRFNFMNYLKKEIKARPDELMSNIVMNAVNSLTTPSNVLFKTVGLVAAIIVPLIVFAQPKIFYEPLDEGYAVRFYTMGWMKLNTAEIPETYKDAPVVGIRGDVFAYMPFLKKVTLPNTIREIRGKAFKNDYSLTEINIPTSLTYLGGGAFYNCSSLKSITLPDTLTYMGGETFYNATSLESVRLSESLPEIRGNTFENCSSLTSITIPDNVTRIGGHAFYGCSGLSEVKISENSNLKEIGSSAFRRCDSLMEITIPYFVSVNDRAFKESPTALNRYDVIYEDTNEEINIYE